MVCSFPLLQVPIPVLSPCPPLFCSHEVIGVRAWVFLWRLPAVLWACWEVAVSLKRPELWRRKQLRSPWLGLQNASAAPKSTLNTAGWGDCEGGPSQTWRGPGTCQVSDLQSLMVKSPCFCISTNSVVTQGLKLPKGWKTSSTQLSLNLGGIWAMEI